MYLMETHSRQRNSEFKIGGKIMHGRYIQDIARINVIETE